MRSTDPTPKLLLVTGDAAGATWDGLEELLAEEWWPLRRVSASRVADELTQLASLGRLPDAVIVPADVADPTAVGPSLHRAAPSVQIVAVVPDEDVDAFTQSMHRAPLPRGTWRIARPDVQDLTRILADASRVTRQRSKLRTTLERMNLRMQQRSAPEPDALRRLLVSDRHLASILEYAEDAIVSLDDEDRVATWNRGAARLFGYDEEQAVGRPVDFLVQEDQVQELRTILHTARTGWPLLNVAMYCRRQDGSRLAAEITLAPVKDDAGRTVSVSLIARDVTERSKQEEEIRTLNAELERRVKDLAEANRSLKRALEMLDANKRELVAANAELELQATTDALTGLKNRIVFQNSLLEMMAVAARQDTPLSVLLVDIDHFKRVNDTLGHLEGDRVLRAVATALAHHTREQDVVARFGGEEFAVLLPNTGADAALAVAENLRVGCRKVAPTLEPELTVSLGAATYRAGDSDVTLLDRADRALYASKASGRNVVTHARDVQHDASHG